MSRFYTWGEHSQGWIPCSEFVYNDFRERGAESGCTIRLLRIDPPPVCVEILVSDVWAEVWLDGWELYGTQYSGNAKSREAAVQRCKRWCEERGYQIRSVQHG
jgi:hypothetical protein